MMPSPADTAAMNSSSPCRAATSRKPEEIASYLRHRVHALAPTLAGIAFPAGTLSISVGVASRTLFRGVRRAPGGEYRGRRGAVCASADSALYVAKNCGRNAVSVA